MSKITTHILDTAKGCPAEGVRVTLYRVRVLAGKEAERIEEGKRKTSLPGEEEKGELGFSGSALRQEPGYSGEEVEIAGGRTNKDGRINDWLDTNANVPGDAASGSSPGNGIYKIRFETRDYFDQQSVASLYPFVDIYFEMTAEGHYHIPLLISPFGYSTYRGS
jgi:5-hydroxyisourate hydrolase